MSGLRVSKKAVADLSDIWDYTTVAHWGPRQAERYIEQVRGACRALAAGAQGGVDAGDVRSGYRQFFVGSHILFFRVADDGCIEVIRILHQRMDVRRHL